MDVIGKFLSHTAVPQLTEMLMEYGKYDSDV